MEGTTTVIDVAPGLRANEMVVERGYPGSRSHFRRLVATLRPRKPAEAYQRLSTLSGEEAQVDWASFGRRVVGNATRRVSAFGLAGFRISKKHGGSPVRLRYSTVCETKL